jgi:hypothetical protein
MNIEKRMKTAGIVAGITAIVWSLPHFWFWFGFSLTYPGDFPTSLPQSDILWIVGGFAIVAAIYAIASSMIRPMVGWCSGNGS